MTGNLCGWQPPAPGGLQSAENDACTDGHGHRRWKPRRGMFGGPVGWAGVPPRLRQEPPGPTYVCQGWHYPRRMGLSAGPHRHRNTMIASVVVLQLPPIPRTGQHLANRPENQEFATPSPTKGPHVVHANVPPLMQPIQGRSPNVTAAVEFTPPSHRVYLPLRQGYPL